VDTNLGHCVQVNNITHGKTCIKQDTFSLKRKPTRLNKQQF